MLCMNFDDENAASVQKRERISEAETVMMKETMDTSEAGYRVMAVNIVRFATSMHVDKCVLRPFGGVIRVILGFSGSLCKVFLSS